MTFSFSVVEQGMADVKHQPQTPAAQHASPSLSTGGGGGGASGAVRTGSSSGGGGGGLSEASIFGRSLSEEDSKYVKEITQYSMQRLEKEPAILKAESNRLLGATQALAVHHYRHFVTTTQAIGATTRQLQAMDESVKALIDHSLPNFTRVRIALID